MPPKPTGPKPPGYRNLREREEDFRQENLRRVAQGLPPLPPPIYVVEGIPIEGDIPGLPVARVANIRRGAQLRVRGGLRRGIPIRRDDEGIQHHQRMNNALNQRRQERGRLERQLEDLEQELRQAVIEAGRRERARSDSTVSNASSTSTEGSR